MRPKADSTQKRLHAESLDTLLHPSSKIRRWVRRPELRKIVPLCDTTIYELEQKGEFPRRFNLTPRCVVWDLSEIEAWVEARRTASEAGLLKSSKPDVRLRKTRPIR
jgi:prophage regulatory protein